MKLRLTPPGTLWPSVVMASMSIGFLPMGLMIAPSLVGAALLATAQIAGFRIWESFYDRTWPASRFVWSPVLALGAHGALALTVHAYRPWRDKLTGLDLLAMGVIAPTIIVLPFVLLQGLAFVAHVIIGAVAFFLIRSGSVHEDETSQRRRPGRSSETRDEVMPAARWRLSQVNRVLLRSTLLRPNATRGVLIMFAIALFSGYQGST